MPGSNGAKGKWRYGPPQLQTAPWKAQQAGNTTWNANVAWRNPAPQQQKNHQQKSQRRPWTCCPNRACSSWAYDDNKVAFCRACGCDWTRKPFNEQGAAAGGQAGGGGTYVKRELLNSMDADNPARVTLQALLDSGAAQLEPEPQVSDPFIAAQTKLKEATHEMGKSQNYLNHCRNNLWQIRNKLAKQEAELAEAEKDLRGKLEAQREAHTTFEALVKERDLTGKTAPEASKPAGSHEGNGGNVVEDQAGRIAGLEDQLLQLQLYIQQLQQQLPQHGAAPSAAQSVQGTVGGAAPGNPNGKKRKKDDPEGPGGVDEEQDDADLEDMEDDDGKGGKEEKEAGAAQADAAGSTTSPQEFLEEAAAAAALAARGLEGGAPPQG